MYSSSGKGSDASVKWCGSSVSVAYTGNSVVCAAAVSDYDAAVAKCGAVMSAVVDCECGVWSYKVADGYCSSAIGGDGTDGKVWIGTDAVVYKDAGPGGSAGSGTGKGVSIMVKSYSGVS